MLNKLHTRSTRGNRGNSMQATPFDNCTIETGDARMNNMKEEKKSHSSPEMGTHTPLSGTRTLMTTEDN